MKHRLIVFKNGHRFCCQTKDKYILEIDTYGDKNYSKNNKAHRTNEPSVIMLSQNKVVLMYYLEGKYFKSSIA